MSTKTQLVESAAIFILVTAVVSLALWGKSDWVYAVLMGVVMGLVAAAGTAVAREIVG